MKTLTSPLSHVADRAAAAASAVRSTAPLSVVREGQYGDTGLAWSARLRKSGPLAAIVLAHGVMFYLMQSGMLRNVVHAVMPQVVNVTFVAPPAAEPKPSTPPKTVQVARQLPTFVPPLPVMNTPQTEPTITVAQAQPHPVEAVAAVAATPSPQPAPPAVPSTPRTITGVEYIRAPQPVYPGIARRMGETGTVVLRVLIGDKGLPEQAVIQKSSGSSNLDEAGRQAAMRALYKPFIEDGKAVPVYVLVPINFQLS